MERATQLADVIRLFDPRKPLLGEALERFYIDRPGNPQQRILDVRRSLSLSDLSYVDILLGLTTALFRRAPLFTGLHPGQGPLRLRLRSPQHQGPGPRWQRGP